MPDESRVLVFVGIRNTVVALDEATGAEAWRTILRSGDFVSVLWDGVSLFATNAGEVWRLDPANGRELWRAEMKGLGRGLVSLASSRVPSSAPDVSVVAETARLEAARTVDS